MNRGSGNPAEQAGHCIHHALARAAVLACPCLPAFLAGEMLALRLALGLPGAEGSVAPPVIAAALTIAARIALVALIALGTARRRLAAGTVVDRKSTRLNSSHT